MIPWIIAGEPLPVSFSGTLPASNTPRSMPDLLLSKRLKEERFELAKRMRELNERAAAEKRDFNAEESGEWDRLNQEYDAYQPRIDRAERVESFDQRSRPDLPGREDYEGKGKEGQDGGQEVTEEHRSLALRAWCRHQYGMDLEEREEHAAKLCGVNPRSRELAINLRSDYPRFRHEMRALAVGTTTAGGFTIPQGFVNALETALLAYGGVRQVADVMRTDTGNPLPWPTANDTGNAGVLLAEGASIGSSVDPVFGQVVFNAYKFSSQLVLVSAELLQDSAFDLPQFLGEALGTRIGRAQSTYFTTGTGTSQPKGIVTAATLGRTAAGAAAITADDILNLVFSVDPAYRQGSAFLMHDAIFAAIRTLKDTTGRYLWDPSIQANVPDMLWGYPLYRNQSMTGTIATTNKTVLFGQLSKYKIRDVAEIRLRRLVERYADTDQEGFVAFLRSDGNLLNAGTGPVKYLQQA